MRSVSGPRHLNLFNLRFIKYKIYKIKTIHKCNTTLQVSIFKNVVRDYIREFKKVVGVVIPITFNLEGCNNVNL